MSRDAAAAWAPTAARVATLADLTAIFQTPGITRDDAVQAVARALFELTGDLFGIQRLSANGERAVLAGVYDGKPRDESRLQQLLGRRSIVSEMLTASVLHTGDSLLIPRITPLELTALSPRYGDDLAALGPLTFLAVAVRVREHRFGLLMQARPAADGPIDEDERLFLEYVGEVVGLGLRSFD